MADALQTLGIHVGQEHLLKALAHKDGLSQSELATAFSTPAIRRPLR